LGKREAEADASVLAYAYPSYGYNYGVYGYPSYGYPAYGYAGHYLGKREAEPQGVSVHPGLATSSTYRSVQGAAGDVLLNRYNSVPLAYNYYPTAYGYY